MKVLNFEKVNKTPNLIGCYFNNKDPSSSKLFCGANISEILVKEKYGLKRF